MLTWRRLFALAAMAALVACAQVPSQRLATTEHRVEGVLVYTWSAGDVALSGSGARGFVQTLQRNGLPVSGFVNLDHALPDLTALERAWEQTAKDPRTTHALVLTRQHLSTLGAARYIRYEAVLWEAASHQLVWQSRLASLTNELGRSTEQRTESLAGAALRGLARDGFITLPQHGPLDAEGAEIPPELVPFQID